MASAPPSSQQLDDLLVYRAAIAEDHRLKKRGPTKIVHMIHINSGVEQKAHRFRMDRGGQQE